MAIEYSIESLLEYHTSGNTVVIRDAQQLAADAWLLAREVKRLRGALGTSAERIVISYEGTPVVTIHLPMDVELIEAVSEYCDRVWLGCTAEKLGESTP